MPTANRPSNVSACLTQRGGRRTRRIEHTYTMYISMRLSFHLIRMDYELYFYVVCIHVSCHSRFTSTWRTSGMRLLCSFVRLCSCDCLQRRQLCCTIRVNLHQKITFPILSAFLQVLVLGSDALRTFIKTFSHFYSLLLRRVSGRSVAYDALQNCLNEVGLNMQNNCGMPIRNGFSQTHK